MAYDHSFGLFRARASQSATKYALTHENERKKILFISEMCAAAAAAAFFCVQPSIVIVSIFEEVSVCICRFHEQQDSRREQKRFAQVFNLSVVFSHFSGGNFI